jgi:phosphomannomutase
LDEQGRQVPTERLLMMMARHVLSEHANGVVVLEEGMSPGVATSIEALGGRVVLSDARRSAMVAAMCQHGAILGAGPSGRCWHVLGGTALPDALMTLTWVLVILSRSDRCFSEVLDAAAAEE